MKELNIGLIGCGTVGSGLVYWITENASIIAKRCGIKFVIKKICIRDLTKDRNLNLGPNILTTEIEKVVSSKDIDVVVELMGGIDQTKEYVLKALHHGKPIITANKALLAHCGWELFQAARSKSSDIYYEASVGGGIPIIKSLREGFAANHITKIIGILNGTCNYILSRMEEDGVSFQKALAAAQKLGYAETDPTLDLNGMDAAHKVCILASLAFGTWYDLSSVYVEGIEGIELGDLKNASEAGYKVKLLGLISRYESSLQLRVHPTLIPKACMLANVNGVNNAVWLHGDMVGETMLYGQGAGADATTSSVIADLIDVGLNLNFDSAQRVAAFRNYKSNLQILRMEELSSRYYLRFLVDDKPDVLASITHILGEAKISIASVSQKESHLNQLPIVIITHLAKEGQIQQALEKISKLPSVHQNPVLIRIEDL